MLEPCNIIPPVPVSILTKKHEILKFIVNFIYIIYFDKNNNHKIRFPYYNKLIKFHFKIIIPIVIQYLLPF